MKGYSSKENPAKNNIMINILLVFFFIWALLVVVSF
jgi:hypothetical protein